MDPTPVWTSHDIDLPAYGPYNKQYVGFSHRADPLRGLRLDIDVLPGLYRRSVMDTRAVADGGARLWQARPDLLRFVYRYQLAERLFMEADFTQEGARAAVRCTFVNDTPLPQSAQVDFCFSLRVPSFLRQPLPGCEVASPPGARWIPAAAYDAQEGLPGVTRDGFRLGEEPEPGAMRGCLMALPAGTPVTLHYTFPETEADSLLLRYRAAEDTALTVAGREIALPACAELTAVTLPLPEGRYPALTLRHTGAALRLDGFVLGKRAGDAVFTPWPRAFVPEITPGDRALTLRYPLVDRPYTLRWDAPDLTVRTLRGAEDGDILTNSIHNHVSDTLYGHGEGHFVDLFVRPVFLAPRERKTFTLLIAAGEAPGLPEALPFPELEANPCGAGLRPSMERLRASTALNVVYPVYYRGRFIRGYTPGRVWDCFYTWDCGMIALGLLTLDKGRALDCLRAYLMPGEDPASPFLNHGTPLITQMFGFKLLLDGGEKEACRALYPALRRAYRFFRTLPRPGGLIAAWQLFYNSGGWDDYPAQRYLHEHHLEATAAPVILTAMMLIYGSILSNAARQLDAPEDAVEYAADREIFAAALAPCWDEETGYFGYSTGDGSGAFTGILRDEQGVDPNQGLDGLYPLLAGIGTPAQRKRMLANLRQGLCTPIGVSVVDTRSPYFSSSGYWNGSVWMPHQWILWKALLDLGEAPLAHRIARTALRLWRRETDATGNTYEHFMLTNGRGAGFHHFSGLSSPVLNWFAAYYTPGTATVGFDTAILAQAWNREKTAVTLTLETHRPRAALILTLAQGPDYAFPDLPEGTRVRKLHPGTYCLELKGAGTRTVTAEPCRTLSKF